MNKFDIQNNLKIEQDKRFNKPYESIVEENILIKQNNKNRSQNLLNQEPFQKNTEKNELNCIGLKRKLDFSNVPNFRFIKDNSKEEFYSRKNEKFKEKIEKINNNLNKINQNSESKKNYYNSFNEFNNNLTKETSDSFISKYPFEVFENLKKFTNRKNDEINYPHIDSKEIEFLLR